MMSIVDLQAAITQLSTEELEDFRRWFGGFLADQWDRQIEADLLAGGWTRPVVEPWRTSRTAAAQRSPERLRLDWILVPPRVISFALGCDMIPGG